MSIHAPYNFVPLSKETVTDAKWKDEVNHDIPFEDGLTGSLDVTLTARTPIFIRQGSADKKAKEHSFCKRPDGKFFIPATSIKGEIRNILEIISFSKMTQVGTDRYSIRDLRNPRDYRNKMTDIRCGLMWLDKDQNLVFFEDHGKPVKISHKEIDEILGIRFEREFQFRYGSEKTLCGEKKLAKYKYDFVKKHTGIDYRDPDKHLEYNNQPYIIVFTGQPGWNNTKNKDGRLTGKHHEYLIIDKETEEGYKPYHYKYDTLFNDDTEGFIKDFLFINKDNPDWVNFWEKDFKNGNPIPVFMTIRNDNVCHFGLTYLYRLPYPKTLNEYVPDSHKLLDLDMGEAIFGKVGKKPNNSLKGRVQISHAEAVLFNEDKEFDVYQSSPKPTFYPAYIKQSTTYETMSNEKATLRGRKLYAARKRISNDFPVIDSKQKDNVNPFKPLSEGSQFTFKINFHNLRVYELGALLRSIVLWDNCFHSIGALKPYGYGSCKMELKSFRLFNEEGDPEDANSRTGNYIKKFEDFIGNRIKGYNQSEQIKELKALLNPDMSKGKDLSYMQLKDFAECKKKKEVLEPYTKQR